MDLKAKLVELLCKVQDYGTKNTCEGWSVTVECKDNETVADHLIAHGVTVQDFKVVEIDQFNKWISVKERTPTEADGTVWVCLADVFPYNEKEPYIDAKHDRRITEAFYSQFSKRWYKDGAVFPDGIVTHWMEKPQPPKGE